MAAPSFSASTFRWPKHILPALLLLALLLPAGQAKFHLVEFEPLGGYAEPAPSATFTLAALRNNTFQPALEKHPEDRIGFRKWLIRFRNQLAYSVFNLGRADGTVVGEDAILFDGNAVNSFLDRDFVGETEINRNVRHFKDVQDTLARHGTLLVFAIAPGKSPFYEGQLPAHCRRQPHTRSNYTAYAEKLAAAGANLIDFRAIFRQWKSASSYPLFPRGGIHWSLWDRDRAVDTLFGYVRQRGHFDTPRAHAALVELSTVPRDTDNALVKVLNLFKEPPAYQMAYSKLLFESWKLGHKQPNLLLVGDSFAWGLIEYMPANFDPGYYNERVDWSGSGEMPEGREVGPLDKRAQLKGRDMVLFTEPNITRFDHDFTNTLYKTYHLYTADDNARIPALKQELMADTAVANRVWRRAYAESLDGDVLFSWEARNAFDKIRS